MGKRHSLIALAVGVWLASAPIAWADWEHDLSLEAQHFFYADSLNGDQALSRSNAALGLESRFTTESERGIQFTLVPFVRLDASDSERDHIDLREAHVLRVSGDWVWQLGLGKEFWGVTESQHLVDIINQTDNLEGSDGEDKLGQPMVKLTREFEQGRVDAYLLPVFREREFLSAENRFGAPVPLSGVTRYESADEENHLDAALRFSGYAGSVDYGISWFKGTARAPSFLPANLKQSGQQTAFDIYYPQLEQWGIDAQYTGEAALWKLEAVHRERMGETSHAAVGGVEYTFFALRDGLLDLGLLAELHTDSRDDRGQVVFQDDAFIGARFGFNDAQSSSLLAGGMIDLEDDSTSLRVEGERRLRDNWKLEVEAQWFSNIAPGNAMQAVQDNDFLRLTLHRYF